MIDLKVVDPKASFVDVGSERMHVSIGGGGPKIFGTMTVDLESIRDYFLSEGVRAVAMEATGVYWLPLYSILEAAKLRVVMVDGRQLKNVPGRKTDIVDCQWGATLHAHGLLRAGFVPEASVRKLQDYMRLRGDHISIAASHILHMHKALERMNVKLQDEISSIAGASGLAIIEAILAGERDPVKLLALCHISIRRNKPDRIVESLRGTWQEEHLFALRQAYRSWKHYQELIAECDAEIAKLLPDADSSPPAGRRRGNSDAGINAPKISGLRRILIGVCGGQDLTQLPAHTEYSVLQLISEVGTDLTKWPTEKHFSSWAGLAPGCAQSGKRRRTVRKKRNRVGRIFCVMARSLARSKNIALGAYYRRLASRRGGLVANIALARKLACLFWQSMVRGLNYVEEGIAQYQERYQANKHKSLNRLAHELGYKVVSA